MGIQQLLFNRPEALVDLGLVKIDYDHDVPEELPERYREAPRYKGVASFHAYATPVGLLLRPSTQRFFLANPGEGVIFARRCKSLKGKNLLLLGTIYNMVTHDLVIGLRDRQGEHELYQMTIPKKIGGESLARQEISDILAQRKGEEWHILRLAKQ